MTDRNDEIRQANRKALPRFLLTMFCAALVGGTFGYCAAAFGLESADPYEKVKALQTGFDPACLRFSPEYYDILGLEGPEREGP